MGKKVAVFFLIFVLLLSFIPSISAFAAETETGITAPNPVIWADVPDADVITLDSISDKKPGDSVVISGTTTFDETTIKVIAPNTTVLYLDVVKGTPFTTTFNLPSDAKEGTYTVIAGRDSAVATITFNVISEPITVPVSGISLDKTAVIVKVGEEVQLTAIVSPANATNKGVTWLSANEAVATVDQAGKVTAIKAGSTTITVKTVDGNYTAKCEVTVEETAPGEVKVTGVTLDKSTAVVKVGETVQLTATVTPANATNKGVTWSSSNEAVATVDQTGKVKAVKAGSAAITVTTKDGNFSASCDITVQNKPSEGESSSGGGSSTPNTTPNNPTMGIAEIIIDGQRQQDAVTATSKQIDGKTVITVKINETKVIERIKKEQANSTVKIYVDTKLDVVVSSLSGDILEVMGDKDMVLEIKTEKATYLLPISQINMGEISKKLGFDVELKDINLEISIVEPKEEEKGMLDRAVSTGELNLIGEPVKFEVNCSYGDKNIAVSRFNQYIQREILIPDSVDTSKTVTAVVLNSNGTLSTVPTKIIIRDGKKYVVISSLTNSIYAVVSKEKSFADVENHWAKKEVNDMASRLIINGIDENTFAPNKDITRAEFATIITKALGLRGKEATLTFTDIQKGAWYYEAVAAAYEYGIVGGYEDNTFRANKKITRQEAMVMLSRAMKIAGMEVELEVDAVNEEIIQFEDAEEIANWAKNGAAICIKNNIFSGSEGRITPKANITRGQTAVVVYRLLVNAGLI